MEDLEHKPMYVPRYVYGIQSGQFIKIGVAISTERRMETMRLYNPHPFTLVFRRKTECAYHCERRMHEILSAKSIGREWFDVTLDEVKAAAVIGILEANKVWRAQLKKEIAWRMEVRARQINAPAVHLPDLKSENSIDTIAS